MSFADWRNHGRFDPASRRGFEFPISPQQAQDPCRGGMDPLRLQILADLELILIFREMERQHDISHLDSLRHKAL